MRAEPVVDPVEQLFDYLGCENDEGYGCGDDCHPGRGTALAALAQIKDEFRRMQEALAFYAAPDSYEPQPRRVRPVIDDHGARARAVLPS